MTDLDAAPTLGDLLRLRAERTPDHGFALHTDVETAHQWLSYAELDRRADVIADELAANFAPGSRALLLFPPGLAFVEAFFGALRAGLVAVPVYPPGASLTAWRGATERIAADCAAEGVLSTAELLSAADAFGLRIGGPHIRFVATDTIHPGRDAGRRRRRISADDPAFLQYTSGSTGSPKGVVLRHRNLLDNQACIHAGFGLDESDRMVSWLPLYHDMGLIGCVIHAVYRGFSTHLMSPMDFLQHPVHWLRLMSTLSATVAGSPNFGYELCVRRITPADRDTLDLSSWRVAFNGAEPVQAGTLRRFSAYFGPCGFNTDAFLPCYGLAESTLFVSGRRGPAIATFDRDRLAKGEAVRVPPDPTATELVSCGPVAPGYELVIVDPDHQQPVEAGRIGEIWLRGGSVARGYWNGRTGVGVFDATLPGTDGRFLRTGDLGFLLGGQLHIVGRIKDVMIVRGLNVFPEDIECCVQQSDRRLRQGCGAAFQAPTDDGDGIVVVQETVETDPAELDAILATVRRDLAAQIRTPVTAVHLVGPRTLPKTSSGKLRRSAVAEGYASGTFTVLASSGNAAVASGATPTGRTGTT